NFIPAQATTAITYAANLPTQPKTPASSSAAAGTITAAGGLNPADFSSNPIPVGTTSYLDNTIAGSTPVTNKLGADITSATLLSGGVGTDSLNSNFAVNDTITVDGQTITIRASGATGNDVNVTDTVGTLLNKIGAITGVNPTISATGQITLHTGTS